MVHMPRWYCVTRTPCRAESFFNAVSSVGKLSYAPPAALRAGAGGPTVRYRLPTPGAARDLPAGLRRQLDQQAKQIAASQVDANRLQASQLDTLVESRLIESLTGVTAAEAERLNIVMPGVKPERTVWKTVNRGIDKVINTKGPLVGYIVVSAEASDEVIREQALRDPKVQAAIAGKQIVKVIVVPRKLINIVVKQVQSSC